MSKRVCFIANNASGGVSLDGQIAKTRLWLSAFDKEGVEVDFVELDGWTKHVFSLLRTIRHGIQRCDVIVLMAAARGTRTLIPIINRLNKRSRKRFVYSFIGAGPLASLLSEMSETDAQLFLNGNNRKEKRDHWIGKELSRLDALLPETGAMKTTLERFYGLNNVHVLNNFRFENPQERVAPVRSPVRLVYLSRISEEKGIDDLLWALSEVNKENTLFSLSIYGPIQTQDGRASFLSRLNKLSWCAYRGILEQDRVHGALREYDLCVFPTRYTTECVPGIIMEAFLAGIPVLSSAYPQSEELLRDGEDSMLYRFRNKGDLKTKLLAIASHPEIIDALSKGALQKGKQCTYEYCRNDFLRLVLGIEAEGGIQK